MPRAEAGSTKDLANKMKMKGLQRLRWWCEPCSKQCRDANGFKCHVQSESHIRQMQVVGEDPRKYINNFSNDFQRDFVTLLRTAHGEKWIGANRFYNEYIRDKEHVHMNATKWASLTEFVKHLGREGICHVKEDEKDGLMIAWRDSSAAAVQRREEIRAMEAAEARSGAGEDKMLKRMAKRAQAEAEAKAKALEAKKAMQESPKDSTSVEKDSPHAEDSKDDAKASDKIEGDAKSEGEVPKSETPAAPAPAPVPAPVKISFGLKPMNLPNKAAGSKKPSVFKRARAEGEEKPVKKVKL
ncbi:hypothetical protein BS50DRAFT_568839 [Corynespora cassiicola Philippines]|uniref:C2H2-type domain-containing protein n=1 Tax=Corynespora cassiicola Philippines TaxID=1448308 RepID=A0A2T2P7E5_CORCC|nr:hypothetical protein BS50DRAFT_568839 [Corynespora cassiicola Philippines]